MADFQFLRDPLCNRWVISAPRRANRTNVGEKHVTICPFCPGNEKEEQEVYRIAGEGNQDESLDDNWRIRVVTNRFPFAPIHEIIIHSPDHHKSFDELPFVQVELILKTYRARYNTHIKDGQVYIFQNHGVAGGESLPHPHTQLVVIPKEVKLEIPRLDNNVIARSEERATKQSSAGEDNGFKSGPQFLTWRGLLRSLSVARNDKKKISENVLETDHFFIFCPTTSEWPDEVWIAPKKQGEFFGSIADQALSDFAFVLCRLIQIFDLRHGSEFPLNFYIYPGKNWYLRLIPRVKIVGGFELGTGIMVNTQQPSETLAFIKDHFWRPDINRIREEHQADYWRNV